MMQASHSGSEFYCAGSSAAMEDYHSCNGYRTGQQSSTRTSAASCTQNFRHDSFVAPEEGQGYPWIPRPGSIFDLENDPNSWWNEFVNYEGAVASMACENVDNGWDNPEATITPVMLAIQDIDHHFGQVDVDVDAAYQLHGPSEDTSPLSQSPGNLRLQAHAENFSDFLQELEACPSLSRCSSSSAKDSTAISASAANVPGCDLQYCLSISTEHPETSLEQTWFDQINAEPGLDQSSFTYLRPPKPDNYVLSSAPPLPDLPTDHDLNLIGSIFDSPPCAGSRPEQGQVQYTPSALAYQFLYPALEPSISSDEMSPQSQDTSSRGFKTQSRLRRATLHRDKSRDDLLLQYKTQGMKYSEIKILGGFEEAESTLRGRVRALTKPKEARVRKPEWSDTDISNLKRAVSQYHPMTRAAVSKGSASVAHHGSRAHSHALAKVPWKAVAKSMAERGGYHYGPATVKKKYLEIMGFDG